MKFIVYTSDDESLGLCEIKEFNNKAYLDTSKGTIEIPITLYTQLLDEGCWDIFILDEPFTNSTYNLSIQSFEKFTIK